MVKETAQSYTDLCSLVMTTGLRGLIPEGTIGLLFSLPLRGCSHTSSMVYCALNPPRRPPSVPLNSTKLSLEQSRDMHFK